MENLFSGDNSDIVATDSQKNTVYLLAKKFGIKSPEEFAVTLTNHFLGKYRHVKSAHVHVEEYPWDRIRCRNGGQPTAPVKYHNHAFVLTPIAVRYCDVIHQRNGKCSRIALIPLHCPIDRRSRSGLRRCDVFLTFDFATHKTGFVQFFFATEI